MEQLSRRRLRGLRRGGTKRAIDYRLEVDAQPVIVSTGTAVLQIIVKLLSNASGGPGGRRVGADAVGGEWRRVGRGRGHRGRDQQGGARPDLPSVLSRTASAPVSGLRLRASSRSRSAAHRPPERAGLGSRFELVLPRAVRRVWTRCRTRGGCSGERV